MELTVGNIFEMQQSTTKDKCTSKLKQKIHDYAENAKRNGKCGYMRLKNTELDRK